MKVRIKTPNVNRTISIQLDERMTFKDLRSYTKSHDLVGMKVVKPGSTIHQVGSCFFDICDIVGEITSLKINQVSGWINVSFYGSIDDSWKRYNLKAVPRVFGIPTDDGKIRIKRIVTFVVYPVSRRSKNEIL